MIPDSAITQTLGLVALSGAMILTGTNLEVQGSVPYMAERVAYPAEISAGAFGSAVATKVSIARPGVVTAPLEEILSDSRWHKYVTQRIEELRTAQYDFTGLKIPSKHAIDLAWAVATTFFKANTPSPSVVPSEDGDVMFVWHRAGWDLEIEVGPEEIELWAHDRHAGTVFSGSLAEQQERFSSLLNYMAQH
jgi:hypothetical protein